MLGERRRRQGHADRRRHERPHRQGQGRRARQPRRAAGRRQGRRPARHGAGGRHRSRPALPAALQVGAARWRRSSGCEHAPIDALRAAVRERQLVRASVRKRGPRLPRPTRATRRLRRRRLDGGARPTRSATCSTPTATCSSCSTARRPTRWRWRRSAATPTRSSATPIAHINVDECGAPGFFSGGAKLLTADTPHAKLTPDAVERLAVTPHDVHSSRPRALSLTQATELGTVYTPLEMWRPAPSARTRAA